MGGDTKKTKRYLVDDYTERCRRGEIIVHERTQAVAIEMRKLGYELIEEVPSGVIESDPSALHHFWVKDGSDIESDGFWPDSDDDMPADSPLISELPTSTAKLSALGSTSGCFRPRRNSLHVPPHSTPVPRPDPARHLVGVRWV